jgi:hypothetical protein
MDPLKNYCKMAHLENSNISVRSQASRNAADVCWFLLSSEDRNCADRYGTSVGFPTWFSALISLGPLDAGTEAPVEET